MNTPKYYTQIIANLEAGTPPKSRYEIIREYFRLYLPSFSALAPDTLEGFIRGDISYTSMLLIFREGIDFQEARRQKRVDIFDTLEEKRYGPCSLPPLPRSLTQNPLELELDRFREVFGPRQGDISPSRVPGTRQATRTRFVNLGAW